MGYAGLKDRYAITRQWFSIYLPKGRDAGPDAAAAPGVQGAGAEPACEEAAAGDLAGNQFRIVLREVAGDRGAIEANLQAIAAQGVPNYFGAQLWLMAAMWSRAARCWRADLGAESEEEGPLPVSGALVRLQRGAGAAHCAGL